uniref:NADH dehydrogenase subunit 6 n=1 Tax=Embiophila sp. TaxID=2931291 RepID=A0A8T9ZYJ2_9HEMI|nr:NADH dehydrogenase subunit 6 [Embiophila sp.]
MFNMAMSIMFPLLQHPLSMGLLLILQTIMIALMTGAWIKSFWFSYILLITMVSGTLVLFIYMASVASNEKFMSSMSMTWFIVPTSIMIMLNMLMDKISSNYEKPLLMNKSEMFDVTLMMNKMYSEQSMYVTILMVTYLLFSMISSTFIMKIHQGPMRSK